jgi:hypothetical protein
MENPAKRFAGFLAGGVRGFKGACATSVFVNYRLNPGKATAPPQRNMFAGRRCANYWALKSPASVGRCWRKKVQRDWQEKSGLSQDADQREMPRRGALGADFQQDSTTHSLHLMTVDGSVPARRR